MKKPQKIFLSSIALVTLVLSIFVTKSCLKQDKNFDNIDKKITNKISPKVLAKIVKSQYIRKKIVINGRIEADKKIRIIPEISRKVAKIYASDGQEIKQGEKILSLDKQDTEAKIQKALALIKQRNLEYKAAQSLHQKKFQSDKDLALALANLKSAQAELANLEEENKFTEITAPFDGIINKINIKEGDQVNAGQTVIAQFIGSKNKIAVGYASINQVKEIEKDSIAEIQTKNGKIIPAKILFISNIAQDSLNTFRIEVLVNKNEYKIIDGESVKIIIFSKQEYLSHLISAEALSLSEGNETGVKIISDAGKVIFKKTSPIRIDGDKTYMTGINEENALVIIRGHGFVKEGENVEYKLINENDADSSDNIDNSLN